MNAPTGLRLAHSVEQSLVGALMQQPDAIAGVRSLVPVSAIEDEGLRVIYQAILDQHDVDGNINPLAVAERLEAGDRLEIAGGFEFVIELALGTIATPNIIGYARMVADHAYRQTLRRLGEKIMERAGSLETPAELARGAISALQDIARTVAPPSDLVLDMDALRKRYEAQEWAVKGIIPKGALGMFFGASGTFKSFVALDYALHRCYGLPWIGRKTQKGVPVYLAAEGGAGLVLRIDAWHKARGMDPAKCPMRVVVVPLALVTDAGALRAAIEATKIVPSDVIVDTMSQTFSGEENSSQEVADYLRALANELREPFGCTVIVVHHTGHSATERPRGSSAITANVDFLFGVYRDEKEMLATVECVKQKDGERWPAITFGLHAHSLYQDSDGDDVTSLVARHVTDAQEIIAAVSKPGGETSQLGQLLQAIGSGNPEQAVRDAFYALLGDMDPGPKRTAYWRAMKRAKGQGIVSVQGDWVEIVGRRYKEK
jgi:hypothetical protein